MKVLIVTSQIIEDTGKSYRCISNFYDIIKRFSYLGELYIVSQKFNGHNSHNKIEKDLDGLVKYGNVSFSIKKDRVFMSEGNRRIIEPLVRQSDLVISYWPSIHLYKIAKKYNKKFMAFLVGCAWDAYWNHDWRGKMLAPYKFACARYATKHADYVLYVSNEFLQRRYPTNAKFQCGCSNVRIPEMDGHTLQRRLENIEQWDGKTLNIATTAAVDVIYKGQQYVLRAMFELKKKGMTHIHYYLLGGGDNTFLSNWVQKYGLNEQVHFMGIVPHDEVFQVLDKMHVYIQPSLQEGLPRSMVEAMSRGLLCIGANTAAIPELLQPQYVTRQKSYEDIAKILERISKEELAEQAKINFEEAKKYLDDYLNQRRNAFFDSIIKDMSKIDSTIPC